MISLRFHNRKKDLKDLQDLYLRSLFKVEIFFPASGRRDPPPNANKFEKNSSKFFRLNILTFQKLILFLPKKMKTYMYVLKILIIPSYTQDSVIILIHTHRFKLELKINRTNKFPALPQISVGFVS